MSEQQWQRVRLEGVVELSVPAGVSASTEQAYESPVGVWEGAGIIVVVDATPYADPLTAGSGTPGSASRIETADGQPVRVLSHVEDGTDVVAARIEPTDHSHPAATIVVRTGPDVPRDVALQIIRSATLA